MNKVARFVTRPAKSSPDKTEPDTCDIVFGMVFKNQSALKPNTVYEVRELMGEMVIVEVGESFIPYQISDNDNILQTECSWGNEIDTLISYCGNGMCLTRQEMGEIVIGKITV